MRTLDWHTGDRNELRAFIRSLLVEGFWTFGDAHEWVQQWIDDSGVVPLGEATALLQSMWAERLAEQAAWLDTGDYGRLRRAFDHLGAEGILARMCFSCCTSCATHDIDDERTPNPKRGDWYRYREWAYAFFHEGDAKQLSTPEPLLPLGYSAFRPHPALPKSLVKAAARGDRDALEEAQERTEVMVADSILGAVRAEGLNASWSGSRRDHVVLALSDWRKPLPG